MKQALQGAAGSRFSRGILLALILGIGGGLFAQDTKSAEKRVDEAASKPQKTYRLTYTLTELDGAKKIGMQHFSLTLTQYAHTDGHGELAEFRLGSKVPFQTGRDTAAPANATSQITYIDVGLNVKARLTESLAGLLLETTVEQSSVADGSIGNSMTPIIRQAMLRDTAVLTVGKPVMIGSLDTPGSTRHLDVEVTMELVK